MSVHFVIRTALLLSLVIGSGCATNMLRDTAESPVDLKNDGATQFAIARVREKKGDLRKAERDYRDLTQKHPDMVKAWHRLGVVTARLSSRADDVRMDHSSRSVASSSGDSPQRSIDQAVEYFERAAELDPNSPDIATDHGYALFTDGQSDAAEKHLRGVAERFPNDERAILNLALITGLNGNTEESMRLYQQVCTEAEACSNLGYIHAQLGDIESAVYCYSQALSMDQGLEKAAFALVQLAKHQRPDTPSDNSKLILAADTKPSPVESD